MKKILMMLMVVSCGLFGCGSTEGTLNTTMASATVDLLDVDSDVVAWVDANGAKATYCAATSYISTPAADSVTVTATFTPYANSTGNDLSVRVERATITYTPANPVSPAISPVYQVIGQVVQPGGSLSMPIRVATQEQKMLFQTALACSSTIYNYYVNISLDVTEIGGKKSTITTAMQLRFADFVDK